MRSPLSPPISERRAMVVFAAGTRCCALAREHVREVLPLPRLFRPPAAPATVAGLMNVGGVALPVLDLTVLFGLPAAGNALYRHIILARTSLRDGAAALLVDRVLDVAYVAHDAIQPASMTDTLNGCVVAEFPLADGTLVHELALDRLLLEDEKERLADLRRAAQARLSEWSTP